MGSDSEKILPLEELVQRASDSGIVSIKSVVNKLAEILRDPASSASELKEMIEIDPPLCAKVLGVANSAFSGIQREVSSIQEAIIFIGFSAIHDLALSLKVGKLFDADNLIFGYSRKLLWKHSLATAICSRFIYRQEFKKRGDNIYSCALLHGIGLMIEEQFMPRHFRRMVEKVYGDKRSFPEVEQEFFGYNCCQVGGALAQCWGFPDEMVETIRYNSMPLEAPEEFQVPAMTVFIADFLCKRNSIGIEEPEGHSPEIYRQCLEALGLKGSAMDLIIKDVKEEIDKLQKQGGLYL